MKINFNPVKNPEKFVIFFPTRKKSLSRSWSESTSIPKAVEAITSFVYLLFIFKKKSVNPNYFKCETYLENASFTSISITSLWLKFWKNLTKCWDFSVINWYNSLTFPLVNVGVITCLISRHRSPVNSTQNCTLIITNLNENYLSVQTNFFPIKDHYPDRQSRDDHWNY